MAYGGVGEGLPPRRADETRVIGKWPRGTQPLAKALVVDPAAGERPGAPATWTPYRMPDSETVQRRRRELTAAAASGAAEPLTAAYLAVAEALIADDRTGAAVYELENALAFFAARRGGAPVSIWRVEALLATMYERLGNPVRARRAAMDAHTHAVRSGCKIAERGTHALLHRLMASRSPAEIVE